MFVTSLTLHLKIALLVLQESAIYTMHAEIGDMLYVLLVLVILHVLLVLLVFLISLVLLD